jgi:4-alpha-glucanotransferase
MSDPGAGGHREASQEAQAAAPHDAPASAGGSLAALAKARGVAVSYTDAHSRRREVSEDSLVAILRALGEPMERAADAPECLRAAEAEEAARPWPPVVVAWDGKLLLEAAGDTGSGVTDPDAFLLELEDGSEASDLLAAAPGGSMSSRHPLPFGLHRLRHRTQPPSEASLVISAPSRARAAESRSWGVFAPTYALSDGRASDSGDLTCLEQLGKAAAGLGASYVATLPLLADYSRTEAPGAVPSPYSPLSRLWWNEGYLDVRRLPELAEEFSPDGSGPQFRSGPVSRRADVAAAAASIRPLLGIGAERVIAGGGARLASFRQFQASRPDVLRYGTYRAAAEAAGPDRSAWPESWVAGDILAGRDVPHLAVLAHVYAQWATDDQLGDVSSATAEAGCRLMLDLPIGCRADGYDPWAFPDSFATEVTVGAPPDMFFSGGQDWGFLPLHPEGARRSGYPVVAGAFGHLLRHCGALRIDHVMGFQRLWWIPAGASPAEGAYVGYKLDELLALALLEAWRADAALVGEDLGTVDPALKQALDHHGIAGMHVAVFDLEAEPGRRLSPRPGSVAFVDTHDTATFAGWFDGTDIDERERLGLVTADEAAAERSQRHEARKMLIERLGASGPLSKAATYGPADVHAVVLEELGTSPAAIVIATLEDLWAEKDPQNIPGTTVEHENFTRRFPFGIEELAADHRVVGPLGRLDRARRGSPGAGNSSDDAGADGLAGKGR